MKSYSQLSIALASCCACALGGYATGAYLQFLHSFAATQDAFARDIVIAQGLVRNQDSELLEWVRKDAQLQYQYLANYETVRNASFPVRLTAVARMTWTRSSLASEALRSSDRWQQMMLDCACGLAKPGVKP
jgi:hypothetical protein